MTREGIKAPTHRGKKSLSSSPEKRKTLRDTLDLGKRTGLSVPERARGCPARLLETGGERWENKKWSSSTEGKRKSGEGRLCKRGR